MKIKKKIIIALGVLVAVAFISGASILAATTLGTSTDPLVTLSYLTGKLKPQIMTDVNASISAAEASLSPSLNAQISGFQADINAKSSSSTAQTVTFSVITLNKDQTVACGVGTEILLRIGTAAAVGSAPALIDSTSGATLSSGGALIQNHMYIVSIQGNGLKVSSSAKIMIRGIYTLT